MKCTVNISYKNTLESKGGARGASGAFSPDFAFLTQPGKFLGSPLLGSDKYNLITRGDEMMTATIFQRIDSRA